MQNHMISELYHVIHSLFIHFGEIMVIDIFHIKCIEAFCLKDVSLNKPNHKLLNAHIYRL